MNHSFTRPGGVWAAATGLLAAELADLDYKSTHSIDDEGGVYALTEDMVIGGSPGAVWEYELPVNFRDEANFFGPGSFYGDLAVDGLLSSDNNSLFAGVATFDASVTFNGVCDFNEEANFYGPLSAYDDLAVDGLFSTDGEAHFFGEATFDDLATFNGNLTAVGNCFLGAAGQTVELLGAIELRGPLTMQDTGAIAHRALAGNDTDTVFSPLAVHEVVMEAGVLTGSTDFYIDDTDCVNGQEIWFGNKDNAAAIGIRRPGGSLIKELTASWGRFVRISGIWQLAQQGNY